jgi:Mg2+/citrate symporter
MIHDAALGWLGLFTVLVSSTLIISRLLSPLVALVVVPTAAALAAGFGLATAQMIVSGGQRRPAGSTTTCLIRWRFHV